MADVFDFLDDSDTTKNAATTENISSVSSADPRKGTATSEATDVDVSDDTVDYSKMKPWERPKHVIYEEIRELAKKNHGVDLQWASRYYRVPTLDPTVIFGG